MLTLYDASDAGRGTLETWLASLDHVLERQPHVTRRNDGLAGGCARQWPRHELLPKREAGHIVSEDNAPRFNELLRDFLEWTSVSTS